ncbi:hypothetical protein GCM10029978_004330 [Actinoallomurus acanthiterrae]
MVIEEVHSNTAARLSVDEYLSDFWPYFSSSTDAFIKLERRQTFREPDDPSWRALDAGDWAEAVRLIDERRDQIQAPLWEANGLTMRRIRIVERPYTPYLQWELYYIRLRAEAGESIRVLDVADIRHLEERRPLPELVILDTVVMYEVLYGIDGDLEGAWKIVDRDFIEAVRREVEDLYMAADELSSLLESEPSILPPPVRE